QLPSFSRLESMRETLCSLVLCNTLFTGSDLSTIFQLKKLRHLDISMLPPMRGENKRRPETTVYKIMEELPALVSLDVGGTKIGDHLYRDVTKVHLKPCIPYRTGDRYLKETPPRKLEFLGLYNCEGCELMDIYSLADTVVGYTGEVQLLASLTYYMNRATPLMYIVGQARQLQTVHNLSCPQRLTTLLLKVLQSHRRNRTIIEEVTANLFYLSSTYYTTCSKQQKNDIITELIISIETCQDMKYVVRNSLVSLFHFDIPGDVIFAFVKISKVILNTLLKYHEDDDIGRHAIHFCNALVCSVQFDMKREASKVGFVPIIVKIIQMRLEANMHDEILEVLWGTLWNVTDETPENSWTFINLGGLQLLQDCFAKFPDEPELHKSIMGLVGNIAEVKEIQPLLVNSTLIQLFCELISKESPNIEIAYNACGTLSHLMSEGLWTIDQPKQEDVISIMTTAIDSWEIDSNRNINYRSFIPILNLVESEVPVCIHWAVWAFRNLCGQDDRYIKMLLKENGREVLSLVENKNVGENTKEMTRWLLQKLESYSQDLNNQYHLHSL
uniref:Protein zer-1 homolog n=1 Tax=Ciona intestinalis TaxID=7719 RepID=F6Y9R7_CIOIN